MQTFTGAAEPTSISLPSDLKAALKERADRGGHSVSWLVRQAVINYLSAPILPTGTHLATDQGAVYYVGSRDTEQDNSS